MNILRKKLPKYLQIQKKSLPLHPHLRNNGSCKYDKEFTVKELDVCCGLSFKQMQSS